MLVGVEDSRSDLVVTNFTALSLPAKCDTGDADSLCRLFLAPIIWRGQSVVRPDKFIVHHFLIVPFR